MLTIRDRVEALVDASPQWRAALGDGLINVSSLARRLHPQIQTDLGKPVTPEAVFMALKRYTATLPTSTEIENFGDAFADLSIRSPLFQVTVADSPRLMRTVAAALNQVGLRSSTYLVFAKGQHELSITASESMRAEIHGWLSSERVLARKDDLTALSLQRQPHGSPAYLHLPMQYLAQHNIATVDVVTTPNELTMLLKDSDVDVAVGVMRAALKTSAAKGRQAS